MSSHNMHVTGKVKIAIKILLTLCNLSHNLLGVGKVLLEMQKDICKENH